MGCEANRTSGSLWGGAGLSVANAHCIVHAYQGYRQKMHLAYVRPVTMVKEAILANNKSMYSGGIMLHVPKRTKAPAILTILDIESVWCLSAFHLEAFVNIAPFRRVYFF